MNKVILLRTDDWEMLYVNGKLVSEYHTIERGLAMTRLKAFLHLSKLHNFKLEDVEEIYMKDEDVQTTNQIGCGLENLSEYKTDYNLIIIK